VSSVADADSRAAARTATLIALPLALIAGAVAFWALGGLGGGNGDKRAAGSPSPQPSSTVRMPAASLAPTPTTVCRGLIAQLPGTIRSAKRRPVSAGAEQNAAYGEPALRVACGVAAPTVAKTATVYELSGVCYLATKQRDGSSVWTTVDRTVPVAITVPGSYSGAGQWAAEFSDTIAGTVPSSDSAPSGCH
jgi:hypothetical protein